MIDTHPIDAIKWLGVEDLHANSYNPNVVYNQELKLLSLSILKNGWIQPILVTTEGEIIDGFHRWWLAKTDPDLRNLTAGRIPCAVLKLSEPERMMLTIRINRAKGSHIACKMHEIVKTLISDYGIPPETIAKEIGATKDEVSLLQMESVFEKLDIKNHKYSRAWVVKK